MEDGKQISVLKEETRQKNLEVRKLADENQKNINSLREALEKADEERRLRDELNAKVKDAGVKRKLLIEEGRKIDAELKAKEQEVSKYQSKGRIPLPRLKRMIEELEWRLQTESMPVKEENAISKEVQKLLKEKAALEKGEPLRRALFDLRHRRHELSMEFRALDGAQELNSKESDKHHEAMLKLYKKADDLRGKISGYLEALGEKRKDADETYLKLKDARSAYEDTEERKYAKERHAKRRKEEERMDELEERAKQIYADFKAGKKITLEELQILQAAGMEI